MPRLLSSHLRTTLNNSFDEDWARQRRTAEDILQRLQSQEGVVLADQVGMGKTYVALAVATSQILRTEELDQVVVFVPARVAEKWVNEWGKFHEALLIDAPAIRCVKHPIRSGEDFLKALDDPPKTRNHLVIVTYEALTATLKDSFIQLALLYYATRNRHEAAKMRGRIAQWSDGARGLIRDRRFNPERIERLLATPPEQWRKVWQRLTGDDLDGDPVPAHLQAVAQRLDLEAVWSAVRQLPANRSQSLEARLKDARQKLNDATQAVWKKVLTTPPKPHMPLLIVDEAHALKNDRTRISRLFTPIANEPEDGALRGIFDRILLVTATPFELGHSELINVLKRLDAVRTTNLFTVEPLHARLATLEGALHRAQATAIRLSESWSHLVQEDLAAFDTWSIDSEPHSQATHAVRSAWRDGIYAARARKTMHQVLRPWIIRHERIHRRNYLVGGAILPGKETQAAGGLEVPESAALPFLLAARAQAVATEDGTSVARPLFAYGIASSYEAFLRLEVGEHTIDTDVGPDESSGPVNHESSSTPAQWYHSKIKALLSSGSKREQHPKISATVKRAVSLWLSGQKCLIFCWYIRTTAALQDALRHQLNIIVQTHGARALGIDAATVDTGMKNISNRLFKGTNHEQIIKHLRREFRTSVAGNDELVEALIHVALRNLRTPAYLIRYTRLSADLDVDGLLRGIGGDNPTKVNLLARWTEFVARMAIMTNDERTRVLGNLQGEHPSTKDDDAASTSRGASLAQVRRAYGGTPREDRERLISVFNTPFAPDILVASSVMGEGIDLHQECRHVIHHDLDWNPSKLEQRTGRLDRIGALAERLQKNIEVYEPYLAGTHDEKMFRVVKDRAGWFEIVMGRAINADEHATDIEEFRVPLHARIRQALTMNLRSK